VARSLMRAVCVACCRRCWERDTHTHTHTRSHTGTCTRACAHTRMHSIPFPLTHARAGAGGACEAGGGGGQARCQIPRAAGCARPQCASATPPGGLAWPVGQQGVSWPAWPPPLGLRCCWSGGFVLATCVVGSLRRLQGLWGRLQGCLHTAAARARAFRCKREVQVRRPPPAGCNVERQGARVLHSAVRVVHLKTGLSPTYHSGARRAARAA